MTALWTAAALTQATGGTMTVPFDARGVSIDTRRLQPGDLFVALHGTSDGHAHVQAALDAGAAGVMVSRADAVPAGRPALLVGDTLAGLTALGRAGRARFTGRVVAVTGSVGKTTTKEMLRTTLSAFGLTHAAEASYNNHWGVPLTFARLPEAAAFCIAEIGMNNPGEILPLALLAAPHVAVITTIGSAHIGHMGSVAAIAEEKATLLDGLAPGGDGVLPADSAFLDRLALRAPGRALTFGQAAAADAHVVAMTLGPQGTAVQAVVAGQPVAFRLAAPGAHMAINALAVLAACHALGLDLMRASAALERFEPGPGRGQQRRIRDGGVLLLDESYNASAASVRAALEVLRLMPADRRVAVLGDMRELGAFALDEHAGLAGDVARSADLLYACGPLTRVLFDGVPPGLRGAHTDDADSLAPIVSAAIRPGDAVLVKGSLGSRMRVVVSALDAPAPPHGGPG